MRIAPPPRPLPSIVKMPGEDIVTSMDTGENNNCPFSRICTFALKELMPQGTMQLI